MQIIVKPTVTGEITNTAQIESATTERFPEDNEDSVVTTVAGSSTLAGTISGTVFENEAAPNNGLANAYVEACNESFTCRTTSTDPDGNYEIAVFASGNYTVRAFPPFDSDVNSGSIGPVAVSGGAEVAGQDIVLEAPTPPPTGTTFGGSGFGGTTSDGIPIIYGSSPVNITTPPQQPGGSATFTVTYEDGTTQTGTLTANPDGTYSLDGLRLNNFGGARVEIFIDNPSAPDETIEFNIYIDPSGHVRETDGTPIIGATVTLYRSDTADGPFTVVEDGSAIMSPSNRKNPDTTKQENPDTAFEEAGHFGWDVIAGYYKVRATNPGCHAPGNSSQNFVDSRIMEIPPPVFDLDLRLECPAAPDPPSITSPANNALLNTSSVTLSGGAEAGTTIKVYEIGANDTRTRRGPEAAATGGNWSVTIPNVSNGSHTYAATATKNGEESELSDRRAVTVDTAKPTVSSFGPTGASEAATVNAFAIFNEAVTGVNPNSFKLTTTITKKVKVKGKKGKKKTKTITQTINVPANVSYDANTRQATLDPSGNLTPGATYTATLTTQIKDSAGNTLAADKAWAFKVKEDPKPKPKPKKKKKKKRR